MKNRISIMLVMVMVLLTTYPAYGQVVTAEKPNGTDAKHVIELMIDSINANDWSQYISLMCSEEREYFEYYFATPSLTDGVKQITTIELIDIYDVPKDEVQNELLYEEYAILETSDAIFPYICEVDCIVSEENQFFYNGINYFLIVLAEENGEIKVAQFNRPSTDLLSRNVVAKQDKNSDIYLDEQKGIAVLSFAERGLVVNAENEILTEGFEVMHAESDAVMTLAADPPVLSHYSTYSYPQTIKVKLDQTGNGQIVTVAFSDYLKNVLPNEWIPSWSSEALKAGAYCVKMVGVYRSISPMSSSGGYNLTQSTQMYRPGSTTYTSTSNMIDAIKNTGMADSAGKIFFPRYVAGTSGVRGQQGGGVVSQYGTQKLASEGFTYKQILNYYYSGSEFSSGDVSFFGYNLGY